MNPIVLVGLDHDPWSLTPKAQGDSVDPYCTETRKWWLDRRPTEAWNIGEDDEFQILGGSESRFVDQWLWKLVWQLTRDVHTYIEWRKPSESVSFRWSCRHDTVVYLGFHEGGHPMFHHWGFHKGGQPMFHLPPPMAKADLVWQKGTHMWPNGSLNTDRMCWKGKTIEKICRLLLLVFCMGEDRVLNQFVVWMEAIFFLSIFV